MVIKLITKDTLIADILVKKPAAVQILRSYGISGLGYTDTQRKSIFEACQSARLNTDEILYKINKL
ncbi:MAG TPA: hypothetical protein DCY20_08985 [Firmicutes bacterium]|nr:hypothetical protein [Bacillota bacterium]